MHAIQAGRAVPVAEPDDQLLRRLARRTPGRVWVDVIRCYGLIGGALAFLASLDTWWVALLSFIVIGTQQYALALIEHDGKHGNLIGRSRANDMFARLLLCAPLGVDLDWSAAQARHREHHRLLGAGADPVRMTYSAENKRTRCRFLLFVSGLPSLIDDVAWLSRARHARVPRRDLVWKWGPVLCAQASIFAAFLGFFVWWYYVAFWLMPLYVLVFIPSKLRTFCEHAYAIVPDRAAASRRLITATPSRLERIFLAPMNIAYHAEHHLWPFVPYYRLPALRRLVIGRADIDMRRSYVGFLWTYFRALPLHASRDDEDIEARPGLDGLAMVEDQALSARH